MPTGSITLGIGGIVVRLDGLESPRVETLRQRYGVFCEPAGRPADLVVSVRRADRPRFLEMRQRDEFYRVETHWEAETLLACSYEWAGWLDTKAGSGGLALAQAALSDPRAFDRSIENYLRVAFAHLVISRGGFLLHSAGLVRDGRAWLFFGPSGSGKTTVTTLTPEALVLSDDLTMVAPMPGGEGGGYGACSVPFRGLFAPEPKSIETWPIAGFFRLVQDTSDRLVEVKGAKAVGELVGSLPFVTERPEIAGAVIDSVAGSTIKTPVFRLHFRKDRTFWQVIDSRWAGVDGFSSPGGIKP
jgi:hypothetical protein